MDKQGASSAWPSDINKDSGSSLDHGHSWPLVIKQVTDKSTNIGCGRATGTDRALCGSTSLNITCPQVAVQVTHISLFMTIISSPVPLYTAPELLGP